jgi:cystathionine gamma-synthase
VPIALSSTFHSAPGENGYLRHESSDTIRALEAAIGALDGGSAVTFASGMAATTAVVEGLPAGSITVAPRAVYSGTSGIFHEQERLGRLSVRYVDVTDTEATVAALPGATLLWIESPTNPLLGIADLPALTAAAHDNGVRVVVDSTFNSPMVLRPLEYGADIVMHSATKYLAGHSDLLMGALVTRDDALLQQLRDRRGLTGAVPGALECYLALRGLRTLGVRMDRAQTNALELARRLSALPGVDRVRFPGLPDDPGHERARRLHDGFGAMISIELGAGAEAAERVCERVRLISHATSLGGVETLIERRGRYEIDAANGTPPNLLRISVGIENVEDLWADLSGAIADAIG